MTNEALQLLRNVAGPKGSRAPIFVGANFTIHGADAYTKSSAWQELLDAGLVMLAAPGTSLNAYGRDFFVTPRGHEWIVAHQAPPEDREGYLAALRADAKLDPFVEAVVAEALWAHERQRPVSALVCVCAAAERMVRFVDDATATPKQAMSISQVWQSLEKRLAGERKRPHVVTFLSTTFTAIRDARNDVAHKGTVADLGQVRRFLLQYLDWHETAAQLRDHPLC